MTGLTEPANLANAHDALAFCRYGGSGDSVSRVVDSEVLTLIRATEEKSVKGYSLLLPCVCVCVRARACVCVCVRVCVFCVNVCDTGDKREAYDGLLFRVAAVVVVTVAVHVTTTAAASDLSVSTVHGALAFRRFGGTGGHVGGKC